MPLIKICPVQLKFLLKKVWLFRCLRFRLLSSAWAPNQTGTYSLKLILNGIMEIHTHIGASTGTSMILLFTQSMGTYSNLFHTRYIPRPLFSSRLSYPYNYKGIAIKQMKDNDNNSAGGGLRN